MPRSEIPLVVATGADPGWYWSFFILMALGVLLTLYRCCLIQDVKQNGQVITRLRWPIKDLLATDAKRVFRGKKCADNPSLNPQVKALLSQVYNGQEITFGVLVYCWGVCMLALAATQLGNSPILLSPTHTFLCVVLGCIAMLLGVFTVIRRKHNNPFTDQELTL